MSNENLFDEGAPTPDTAIEQQAGAELLPDNVKELIGEGKKYKTVAKALEALGHSQEHIARIEEENRQLREAAGQAVDSNKLYETVKELLEKDRNTHDSAPLDVASIEAILDRKLTQRETQQVQTGNANTVKEALVKKYGTKEKAQEIFNARSAELGLDLTSLAKNSPRAALELLGIKGDSTPPTPASRGSLRTEALKPTDGDNTQRKSVMAGATTKDLLEAWRSAAPKTS